MVIQSSNPSLFLLIKIIPKEIWTGQNYIILELEVIILGSWPISFIAENLGGHLLVLELRLNSQLLLKDHYNLFTVLLFLTVCYSQLNGCPNIM